VGSVAGAGLPAGVVSVSDIRSYLGFEPDDTDWDDHLDDWLLEAEEDVASYLSWYLGAEKERIEFITPFIQDEFLWLEQPPISITEIELTHLFISPGDTLEVVKASDYEIYPPRCVKRIDGRFWANATGTSRAKVTYQMGWDPEDHPHQMKRAVKELAARKFRRFGREDVSSVGGGGLSTSYDGAMGESKGDHVILDRLRRAMGV